MDKKKVIELIKKAETFLYNSKKEGLDYLYDLLTDIEYEVLKPDWISVEDELPPYDEEVWVTCKENTNAVWNSYRQKKLCKDAPLNAQLDHNGFTILRSNYPITHWRKIDKLEVRVWQI